MASRPGEQLDPASTGSTPWSAGRGPPELRDPDPLAPVGILFTSGTTSQPKAVVHTHANALWAGRIGPANISMERDDVYLVFLPFFHVNAQSWSLWTTLGVGGTVVCSPSSPRRGSGR